MHVFVLDARFSMQNFYPFTSVREALYGSYLISKDFRSLRVTYNKISYEIQLGECHITVYIDLNMKKPLYLRDLITFWLQVTWIVLCC